jgi:hypothetical protein
MMVRLKVIEGGGPLRERVQGSAPTPRLRLISTNRAKAAPAMAAMAGAGPHVTMRVWGSAVAALTYWNGAVSLGVLATSKGWLDLASSELRLNIARRGQP